MITLFSIPIYSCTREKYAKDYNKWVRKQITSSTSLQLSEKRIKEIENTVYWEHRTWKYNQIIGYLDVDILGNSLCFNAYISHKKIMRFSNKKRYLYLDEIVGLYVNVSVENNDTADELLDAIKSIAKERNYTLDLTQFLMLYKNVDYNRIIMEYQRTNE